MSKIIKNSLIGFAFTIVLIIALFWNKIGNGLKVYSIINTITTNLNEGNEKYNFLITGTFGSAEKVDTLLAAISYSNRKYFLADVKFKAKEYIIKSADDLTQVFMGPSNLIVSGKGLDKGNFDVLRLLGNVLKDFPQTNQITELSFFEKIGISGWTVSNCEISDEIINNQEFKIISKDIDSNNVQILINKEIDGQFYLNIESKKIKANLRVEFNDIINNVTIPQNDEIKTINIEREELNTAIYRGALRTGGLLLSKIEAPKFSKVEKSYSTGKLKFKDGNRVLIAKGTHSELGKIQGALLSKEIREMVDATLYTMCWVYTADRKSWFIDDFRDAYKRLKPFIPKRYDEEMLRMSETSGIPIEEIRLTNVFPALFHCSGFALFNTATIDGKLYHGRVLDYIIDLGLQFNAVVYILKPEGYNAFANVSYAGFIGSVTGMNEKQVTFGEMGGKGEGDWDGMPMGFLMRDGLERANNLDEAVNIFKDTPRTCEYYYVISDGKIPDARGLSTSPSRFEININSSISFYFNIGK